MPRVLCLICGKCYGKTMIDEAWFIREKGELKFLCPKCRKGYPDAKNLEEYIAENSVECDFQS